ncbi:MAG: sigma 54-interacting transcriptional regulator [Syntrophomonas sp.]
MNIVNPADITPLVLNSRLTMIEACQLLTENGLECARVSDSSGRMLGILTAENIIEFVSSGLSFDTPIENLISYDEELADILGEVEKMLCEWNYKHIPEEQAPTNRPGYKLLKSSLKLLQREKKEWQTCIDSIYNPLISIDDLGNVKFFNKALETATGISAHEARGRNINDLFKSSKLIDILKSGKSQATQRVDEYGKNFISNRTPIIIDDQVVGAVAVLQEISDFEQIAEELAHTKELNRQLDATIESSFDGLFITNGEGNVIRFNKGFQRITGINPEECLGRNMQDLIDDGLISGSATLVVLNSRERATSSFKVKNGKEVLVTSTPIFDNNGNIVLIVTNVRDISELNELEREFKHWFGLHEKELDAIFDSTYDGLYITDGQANTLRINDAFARVTGVTSEECVGRNMAELVKEGYFTGSGSILAMEKRERATITLSARNGNEVLVTSTPIFDDDGNIVLIVTNVRDITELNEMERQFKHAVGLREKELDAIFDSSYDGLYITDGEANTIRLNEAFERVLGVKAEECVGRNMRDLVKEDVFSRSGTLLALEKQGTITITLQAKTGRTALVTSTPIFDEQGNIILVVTNVRDVSELNELQDKLEQAEGLSRFYQTELQELRLRTQCVIHSSKMRELITMALRVALVDSTVLIQGESGVGKELVANTIHKNSNRKDDPFIKINCGAIPENLLESELFGYEPGAFTGASKNGKAGLFEVANRGTIFLDEIGDLPLGLQVKLLRVIQDMQVVRVGGTKPIDIDVRIFAGTNYNLADMVQKKQFRKDLYYRLNVIPITVPPLRERREDVPVLSQHFLEMFNERHQLNKRLSNDVIAYFMTYDWPGNVRELQNLIERLVVTSMHDTITLHDVSTWSEIGPVLPGVDDSGVMPLQHALESTERKVLQNAFSLYNSTYEVAKALGVSQPTVVRKAAKYGINAHNHA